MRKTKMLRGFLMIAATLLACFAGQSAQAATAVQVGGCKPKSTPNYTTIQAAVTAAAAGATVYVCSGTYPEQVTINKNLTVLGTANGNSDAPIIVPPSGGLVQNATDPAPGVANPKIAAQLFVQGPATVTIKDIIIDGAGNGLKSCSSPTLVGLYVLNTAATLTGIDVRNEVMDNPADSVCDSGLGIYVEANSAVAVGLTISAVNNFQKNGITANGYGNGNPGPVMNIFSDNVAGQGPTTGALENGIQVGYGASGKVDSNIVADVVWDPGTSGDPRAASTGILIYASSNVTVNSNRISTTQYGVAAVSDPAYGNADHNTITVNYINNTVLFDGIDVCGNNNTVQNNDEYDSLQSGIHVDSTCDEVGGGSSGNDNVVSKNNNTGSCAGVLEGTGTGNTFTPQILVANNANSYLAGDVCSTIVAPASLRNGHPAPGGPGHTVPFR
jgi:hypothetical protein